MTETTARVLNVNDQTIPRYVNEQLLCRAGFTVTSVASGEEALKKALDPFDVVLLDVQLPDVSGFEVCRRLKSDPSTANVIVLLTSATFVSSSHKVSGLDSGADGYLSQPFEFTELVATVRSLLRAREAEREAQALAGELQKAMLVRDEFLAMLGHELRNPLGNIGHATELLRGEPQSESSERIITVIDRQLTNLKRIVGDLLDVARLTRGKIALDPTRIDLCEVVARTVESYERRIQAANHTLRWPQDQKGLWLHGDPVRLEQVVGNLLSNAIKYTPKGGELWLDYRDGGAFVDLEVGDRGIGMDAATQSRVFDSFVQAERTIDRSEGGLGLGLSVVKQLVELHGGRVSAYSDGEGHGSRFVVTLPRLVEPSTAAAEAPPEAQVRPGGAALQLLIIEDNEDARELLALALEARGHHVRSAAEGKSGLELALNEPPDVMLVDIGLPGIDGYEVARRTRAALGKKAPLLLAMTGYGQESDRRAALEAGFDRHLVKPIKLSELSVILDDAARESR